MLRYMRLNARRKIFRRCFPRVRRSLGLVVSWCVIFSGVVSGQGFISLEIKNSPDLQRLHESLVAALNPLREDIFRQEFLDSYHMDFPINKIQQAKQYGYPDALDLFEPHLTLSRLQSPEVAKGIAADIELVEKAFTATRFGIYEMGEHGTCRRLIRDWPLAKHG